jgi:hypothetical protein
MRRWDAGAAGALVVDMDMDMDMEKEMDDRVLDMAPPPVAVSRARSSQPEDTPPRTVRPKLDPTNPEFLAFKQQFAAQGCALFPCAVGGVAHVHNRYHTWPFRCWQR